VWGVHISPQMLLSAHAAAAAGLDLAPRQVSEECTEALLHQSSSNRATCQHPGSTLHQRNGLPVSLGALLRAPDCAIRGAYASSSAQMPSPSHCRRVAGQHLRARLPTSACVSCLPGACLSTCVCAALIPVQPGRSSKWAAGLEIDRPWPCASAGIDGLGLVAKAGLER
jgi:hypothetical protein